MQVSWNVGLDILGRSAGRCRRWLRSASTSLRNSSSSDWLANSSKLARNSAARLRILATHWPTLRRRIGRSFGPTTIRATAARKMSSVAPASGSMPCASIRQAAGRAGPDVPSGTRRRHRLVALLLGVLGQQGPGWRPGAGAGYLGDRRGQPACPPPSSPFLNSSTMPLAASPMMPDSLPRPPNRTTTTTSRRIQWIGCNASHDPRTPSPRGERARPAGVDSSARYMGLRRRRLQANMAAPACAR